MRSASTPTCPAGARTSAAREYLDFIADFIGVPIVLVGVGPGREQIISTDAGDRVGLAAA